MGKKFKRINFLLFAGFVITAILSQKYLDQETTRIVIFSYAGFMMLVLLIKRRIRRARKKRMNESPSTTSEYNPNSRYDTSSLWQRSDDPKDKP